MNAHLIRREQSSDADSAYYSCNETPGEENPSICMKHQEPPSWLTAARQARQSSTVRSKTYHHSRSLSRTSIESSFVSICEDEIRPSTGCSIGLQGAINIASRQSKGSSLTSQIPPIQGPVIGDNTLNSCKALDDVDIARKRRYNLNYSVLSAPSTCLGITNSSSEGWPHKIRGRSRLNSNTSPDDLPNLLSNTEKDLLPKERPYNSASKGGLNKSTTNRQQKVKKVITVTKRRARATTERFHNGGRYFLKNTHDEVERLHHPVANNDVWNKKNENTRLQEDDAILQPVGESRMWDRVAACDLEKNLTGQECNRKAIRIEEKKKLKRKVDESTLDIVKSKIPAKGNTRGWRMNQVIKKMAFLDEATGARHPDLLEGSLNSKTAQKDSDQIKSNLDRRTEAIDKKCCSTQDSVTILQTPNNRNSSTTSMSNPRSSVPCWVMSPNELEILNKFHTGLTPRNTNHVKTDQTIKKTDFYSSDEEECDEEKSAQYATRFASDILGTVDTKRSLCQQRFIDKHRKKVLTKKTKQNLGTQPDSLYAFGTDKELKNVLGQKEKIMKKKQKEQQIRQLKWTIENAESETERQQAADDLQWSSGQVGDEDQEMLLDDCFIL